MAYLLVYMILVYLSKHTQGSLSQNLDVADDLTIPEWQQEIPLESKVAKYRKRRFLSPSSIIDVKLQLIVPGEQVFGIPLGPVALKSIFSFSVPSSFVIQLEGIDNLSFFQGRNAGENRTHFYDKVQNIISKSGLDGHECLLRTICEISEIPFRQGIFGDIINFLFRVEEGPSHFISNSIEDPPIYVKARQHGKLFGSCGTAYPKCPVSLLKGFVKLAS